jgi:hypothetical protein
VVAEVENTGYIPTATEIGKKLKRVEPVKATISGEGMEILAGKADISLGHLDGRPAEPKKTTWIVRAKAPIDVTVTAYVPTGGGDPMSVKVEK